MTDAHRTIVAPSHVGLENRAVFRHAAQQALDALPQHSGCLVIDMSLARFVDSAGLGTLIMIQKYATDRLQSVRLRGVNEDIRMLLSLTKLEDLFAIEPAGQREDVAGPGNALPFSSPDSASPGA